MRNLLRFRGLPFKIDGMDRYGNDILSSDPHEYGAFATAKHARTMEATPGELFEDIETGWCGIVTRVEKSGGIHLVQLEGRGGRTRSFPLGPGFLFEGEPVVLVPPTRKAPRGPQLTNSGSRKVSSQRAKVAKPSRIWVEGRHDAELVEHVWGDDLRQEGIVVCLLDGADHLEEVLTEFGPTPMARAGVLLDHWVAGSKETRIAQQVMRGFGEDSVYITGHPYIDIWQAVKPSAVGIPAWPDVPRGTDFKYGTLERLGWPAGAYEDVARAWVRILRSVRDWRDLEASFLGRVEQIIDFVTTPTAGTDK